MGEDKKYYDVDDYLRWKRNQGKASKVAPRPNILAAASWLRKFFDARKTNWAALGSLAMLCLGARREIPDIHIVYDDKDFQRIRMKLQTDPRVRLPKDMNSMFPFKLLVSTGPKYKDVGCTESADIEVEMIPPGSHGTPQSDILRSNQAKLSLNLDGKITNITGLNIIYLVRTTVHLCTSSDLLWRPEKDLLWLCRKYGKDIQSIRGQLNTKQVQENFLGAPYFSTLSAEDQRLCYHVLLGQDPPPSMLVTPAPTHGQLASATARPPIASHSSAPSLRDRMQQHSTFLRPPMHGKSKTAPGAPPSGAVTETSPHIITGSPRKDVAPEATRDSRSRYRNSSAPTTPSASRNVSPEAATARPSNTIIEHRSDHLQQHSMIYQAQSVNIQDIAHSAKPQVVRTKKSFPRINGHTTSTQAVPVFAHKPNTTSPATEGIAHLTPAAKSAQQGAKVQPQDSALKAQTKISSSSATVAQPQVVAHTHPAHKIVAQHNLIKPSSEPKATGTSSRSSFSNLEAKTPSKGLSVVGPEGLYAKPPKPVSQAEKNLPTAPANQNQAQSTNFVFELDATSPQVEVFPQVATGTEPVAELPTEENPPFPPPQPATQRFNTLPETPISPPQEIAHLASEPAFRDSPVSPPMSFRPLASMIQPLNPEPIAGAPKPVHLPQGPKPTPSPPTSELLPSSLMIGFRGPHPSLGNATSRPGASSQTSNGSNPTMAAGNYQRYYSPPSSRESSPNNGSTSAPASRQPSPRQGPVYKAYTPPVTPPMQPKMEPTQYQKPLPTILSQVLTPPALTPATASAPQPGAPMPMERTSEFVGRASPPNILRAGANAPQPLKPTKRSDLPNPLASNPPTPQRASHMKKDSHQDSQSGSAAYKKPVDYHDAAIPQQQFKTYAAAPQSTPSQYIAFNPQNTPLPQHPPSHQRNVSRESNTSTTSHDSEKLAHEYQLDLPSFENGYGAQKSSDAGAEADVKKSHRPSYAGNGYGELYH